MFEIKGKVALITGGAKGLGLCYAKELLLSGLKGVALVDIDVTNGPAAVLKLSEEFGEGRAIFIKTDVTDRIQFEEAFETTAKTFKHLDIVINNAGIIQELKWEESIAVNLTAVITGSMLAMNKYLPKYKSGNEGLIVNVSSLLGVQPAEELSVYGAAKHGVVGFSRAIGGPIHYEQSNVRVVTLCPGMTDTDTSMTNIAPNAADEPFLSIIIDLPKNFECQKTSELAKNLIHIMKEGKSGSVWAAVKNDCFQVEFPIISE